MVLSALLTVENWTIVNWTMTQGRVAISFINRLGASEMIARVYAVIYGLLNIWKVSTFCQTKSSHHCVRIHWSLNCRLPTQEPWQACLIKHIEAFEKGNSVGDLHDSVANLYMWVYIFFTLEKLLVFFTHCNCQPLQWCHFWMWRRAEQAQR